MAIILASQSPRRNELLKFITEDFTVEVSNVDESCSPSLTPEETVKYLSTIKGEAVFNNHPDACVISADTVVVLDGKILGKPHDKEEAFSMLNSLSGKVHQVFTGVSIFRKEKKICFAEKTEVKFCELTAEEINNYINTGEPFDKAGGYGIQGKGSVMIEGINGDYYNVMGLPVSRLARILREEGI